MNLLRWMVQRRLCALFLWPGEEEIPRKQGAQEKANEWSLCISR